MYKSYTLAHFMSPHSQRAAEEINCYSFIVRATCSPHNHAPSRRQSQTGHITLLLLSLWERHWRSSSTWVKWFWRTIRTSRWIWIINGAWILNKGGKVTSERFSKFTTILCIMATATVQTAFTLFTRHNISFCVL